MAEKTFHSLTLPGQDTARVPLTAVEFNTSTAYKVKDYCTYQGKLYRCTVAHAAGAWNASHFVETDMDAELDRKLDIPPSQASAPANPRVGDLWIDNDENSPVYNVDAAPTLGSTNAVQSGGTKTALNAIDSRKVEHGCITGDFSASVDYRVGDLVFYATTANGITTRTLYRCTTAHNATAWNAAHFTATTLEVELQRVRDNEADTDMIGDLFGAKTTYSVGDYCIYNDNLYRCIQAVDNTGVTTPAFDPDDWTQIALANDVSDLKSAIDDINSKNFNYTLNLTPDKYVRRDDGTLANDSGYTATDYILVKPGQSIIVETPITLAWCARYNKNKTYIEAYGWTNNAAYFNGGTENIYFRMSMPSAQVSNIHITILPTIDTTLTKQGYPADAKTVGERISAISQKNDVIPSYYETQLATKETTIRGHFDNCAYNGDNLVFLTDTHFSADLFTSDTPTSYFNANNSFTLIKNIIDKTGIDKIVFGGDLVNSATNIDTMLLSMVSFQTKFGNRQARLRYCVGNHEYFIGNDLGQTTKPTPSELYGAGIKYNEDVVLAKGDMDTYYFDNMVQKIRYFVVSCGRHTETSVAQVKWVLQQFEEIPNGYKVVCIGHGFMADNMVEFRGGYKPIADALDAVKVGGSYTYIYGTNLSETYDYSALIDVTPVCMITGHTHIDGSLTTSGGIPCICTTTDSYAQNYELVDGTPTLTPRTKGTVNEQAFDIYQFDFTNRKIYVTRIGYGNDREFNY